MSVIEFTDRFLALERDLALFETPEWDTLRFDLFYRSYRALHHQSGAELPGAPVNWRRRLRSAGGRMQRRMLRHQLLRRLAAEPRDVLILRASRQTVDGKPTDTATAQLSAVVGPRAHHIDSVPRYYHLPETGGPGRLPLPPQVEAMTHALAALSEGGVTAATLAAEAGIELARFARRLKGYHRILDAAQPRLIIVNQNGMEKPLFRAAHQRDLPVIEVQHGLIGYGHPGYCYHPDLDYRALDTVPDVFVTFAPHWTQGLHYPVRRIVPLGNDALIPRIPAGSSRDRSAVLVISADVYHDTLAAWTRQAAQMLPDRRFIYKLHPNQQVMASAITAAMSDLSNIQVVDGRVKASVLLGEIGQLVVVQSTVMYEALQIGVPVSVVPVQNYDVARGVLDQPQVAVVDSPAALAARIESVGPSGSGPTYFAPFDVSAAQALIDDLLCNGRPAGIEP